MDAESFLGKLFPKHPDADGMLTASLIEINEEQWRRECEQHDKDLEAWKNGI